MSETEVNTASTKTILVVEDNLLLLEHVVGVIKSLGFNVIEATNGQQALDRLDQGLPIDLLFTDMVMPGGISGRQLAEMAIQKRPGLRVLFTTGYSADAKLSDSILDQEVNLLRKPYRRATLIDKLLTGLGAQ